MHATFFTDCSSCCLHRVKPVRGGVSFTTESSLFESVVSGHPFSPGLARFKQTNLTTDVAQFYSKQMMSEIGSGFGKGKEKSSNNNNNNYSVYGKNMTVRGANELDMVVEGKSILKQRPNVSPYRYSSSLHNRHEFSELEKAELLDYPNVYYSGQNSRRKRESLAEYDDSRGKLSFIQNGHKMDV